MKKYLFIIGTVTILTLSLYIFYFLPSNNSAEVDSNNDFNIVLITIDTLRADHLSCYGYERKTSSNIDNIAKEGIRFTNALATSPWTPPSMASIMTSLYPISHGVNHGFARSGKAYSQEILSGKFNTLAEILKKHGYTTFGAVANVHMTEELGFSQGFDYYYCGGFHKAYLINNVVSSWEEKIKKSKKSFIWVHYFDPHHTYNPKSPWIKDFAAELRVENTALSKMSMKELIKLIPTFKKKKDALEYLIALYDSEISYVDYHLRHLLYKLGLDKNSLIIITSDHGEEFLEHGSLGHAHTLYQELIHVPLIIKLPFPSKYPINSVIDEPVSIIDIMPTILGFSGITIPTEIKGKNLLEEGKWLRKEKRDYLFSELSRWRRIKTVLNKNWKYIFHYKTKKGELYNITKDPREFNNLILQEASTAKKLKRELFNWVSTSPKAPSIKRKFKPSKEIEEKLKSLGYISNGKQKELDQPPEGCNLFTCHQLTN